MAGTFDFCPGHLVPTIIPPEPQKGLTLNGWGFSSKPTVPYQRKFKVMLYGLYWVLDPNTGFFDPISNPYFNARRLELFYQANQCWDNFVFPHPHLGNIQCKFDATVEIPAAIPNSNGLIDGYEVTLIEYNPGYS